MSSTLKLVRASFMRTWSSNTLNMDHLVRYQSSGNGICIMFRHSEPHVCRLSVSDDVDLEPAGCSAADLAADRIGIDIRHLKRRAEFQGLCASLNQWSCSAFDR